MTAWDQERKPRSPHQDRPTSVRHSHSLTAPLTHGTIQRTLQAPKHIAPREMLQLQRTVGNREVQRLLTNGSSTSTIQRAPNLLPDTVGALNRPNWARQHERRYQELIGDLQQDPKAKPLFSFQEYQQFDQEYAQQVAQHGGAGGYVQQFDPSRLQGTAKTSDSWSVYSFNPQVALEHWRKLMTRIERIDTLNNSEFKSLMAFYITALSENNQQKAGFALIKVIDYLDTLYGFQVGRAETKENQAKQAKTDDPDIRALQKETAKFSRQHGQLWSKLNKYIAYETAKEEGGLSLERTLGAKLFDELDFGTTGGVLGPQWTSLSAHFVWGLRGTIHAHAFRGTVKTSVFSTTEWPRIHLMMQSGEIEKLIIHVYDFGENGKDLVEEPSKQIVITKDNCNNAISYLDDIEPSEKNSNDNNHSSNEKSPPLNMEQYWKDQKRAHYGEEDRHKIVKGFRKLPFHNQDEYN